jgi:RNA polymerase sigma factor (sigma-70 family)
MCVEPWIAPLTTGSPEAAWDLFIGRYRRLIFAAIRRYTRDPDDVMDVFARVCEALRENDFARLRRYAAQADTGRRFSTWLCAVVYNLAIDWIRHRDGRERISTVAASLPPIQQRIFEHIFVGGHSHVEAYELLRSRDLPQLTFSDFLKELGATYRAAGATKRGRLTTELAAEVPDQAPDEPELDPAMLRERAVVLNEALRSLPDEDRLAVQMYVVDKVPAVEVARALGWSNAKAVYNHVYRALAQLRARLEKASISAGDL